MYRRPLSDTPRKKENYPDRCSDQPEIGQIGEDLYHCPLRVFRLFAPRDDEFSRSKEQYDHFGILKAVDKAGELFRFVLDPVQVKSNGDLV